MNTGKTLFAQIMDFLPWKTFHRIVARHGGDKKKLQLDASLYTLLQIMSVTLFEKMPLQQAFPGNGYNSNSTRSGNQLNLFTI